MNGLQVTAAKERYFGVSSADALTRSEDPLDDLANEVQRMRWWQQLVAVPAVAIGFCGVLVFKMAMAPIVMLYGLAAFILGLAGFGVAGALPDLLKRYRDRVR